MACSGCYYIGSKDGKEAVCSGKCKTGKHEKEIQSSNRKRRGIIRRGIIKKLNKHE